MYAKLLNKAREMYLLQSPKRSHVGNVVDYLFDVYEEQELLISHGL
jgi:hypothetical protein